MRKKWTTPQQELSPIVVFQRYSSTRVEPDCCFSKVPPKEVFSF
jgi:hypothetical protein